MQDLLKIGLTAVITVILSISTFSYSQGSFQSRMETKLQAVEGQTERNRIQAAQDHDAVIVLNERYQTILENVIEIKVLLKNKDLLP
jgi:hypothetical protein